MLKIVLLTALSTTVLGVLGTAVAGETVGTIAATISLLVGGWLGLSWLYEHTRRPEW